MWWRAFTSLLWDWQVFRPYFNIAYLPWLSLTLTLQPHLLKVIHCQAGVQSQSQLRPVWDNRTEAWSVRVLTPEAWWTKHLSSWLGLTPIVMTSLQSQKHGWMIQYWTVSCSHQTITRSGDVIMTDMWWGDACLLRQLGLGPMQGPRDLNWDSVVWNTYGKSA